MLHGLRRSQKLFSSPHSSSPQAISFPRSRRLCSLHATTPRHGNTAVKMAPFHSMLTGNTAQLPKFRITTSYSQHLVLLDITRPLL